MTTSCAFCGAFEPHNYKQQWINIPLRIGDFYLCSYNCELEFNKLTYEQKKQTPQARALLKEQETKRKLEEELKALRLKLDKLQRAQEIIETYPTNFKNPTWVNHAHQVLVELFSDCDCDDDYDEWDD